MVPTVYGHPRHDSLLFFCRLAVNESKSHGDPPRATRGYLMPQPSPAWLASTAQPASARPEPPLGLTGLPRGYSACARPVRWWLRAAQAAGLRGGPACCGNGGASSHAGPLMMPTRRGHRRRSACVCSLTCKGGSVHDRERAQTGARECDSSSAQRPRTFRRREELTLVGDDGRGARDGSCPGISGTTAT